MSVNELEGGVPIWNFVLTALLFALLAYGIRFAIANDFVADNSRRALERFWARRNVRRGTSIPTLTFISLTVQEIWSHGGSEVATLLAGLTFMSAFIVVPVAFLWSSTSLDLGFNISMTLFLLLFAIGAALVPTMGGSLSRTGVRRRGASTTQDSDGEQSV